MNLRDYAKQLSEKIKFYDAITQNTFCSVHTTNPFSDPITVTVVWVEQDDT